MHAVSFSLPVQRKVRRELTDFHKSLCASFNRLISQFALSFLNSSKICILSALRLLRNRLGIDFGSIVYSQSSTTSLAFQNGRIVLELPILDIILSKYVSYAHLFPSVTAE